MKIKLPYVHSKFIYSIFIFAVLIYLILGVGVHGDDYTEIIGMKSYNLWEFLYPDPYKHTIQLLGFPNFYTYWWAYPVLGYENQWVYDAIKILVHGLSIKLIYIFARDYFSPDRALLFSLLFVLYPLHDTTTYWYMTLYYVTIPAIILYAHSLIRKNKTYKGFLLLLLGSMWHYASPPYTFGLAMIFVAEKKFKKAIFFAAPGFIYLIYYFWFKFSFPDVERRINPELNIYSFIKNMLMQIISFVESSIGPSYWLKVFYSINSLSLVSVIIVLVISTYFFKSSNLSPTKKINKPLLLGLISVAILSFSMFSLTGLYTHSAFNLSNRTTIYGSLLIAFLLSTFLPGKKKSFLILILIFVAPVFGLSDHWKSWNLTQKTIIENISQNSTLKSIEEDSTLIITGHDYSKLGPFSHIEFFSMPWHVKAIFQDNIKTKKVVSISNYTKFSNGYLIDEKFNITYPLNNKIYLYNSINDSIKEINKSDISGIIEKNPKVLRHWSQLMKGTWLQKSIVWLSPRLSYLFK